jgi:hypothetical protein
MASGHTGDVKITRPMNTPPYLYFQNCVDGNGLVEPGQHSCYSAMIGDSSHETAYVCGYYDYTELACTDNF